MALKTLARRKLSLCYSLLFRAVEKELAAGVTRGGFDRLWCVTSSQHLLRQHKTLFDESVSLGDGLRYLVCNRGDPVQRNASFSVDSSIRCSWGGKATPQRQRFSIVPARQAFARR